MPVRYAVNSLSLTAREELRKDNITVSIVCPYIVDTDFGKNSIVPEPESLRHEKDGSVVPGVLSPQKVAEEVLKIIQSKEPETLILPNGKA